MKRLLAPFCVVAMAIFLASPVSAQTLYVHGGAGFPSSEAFSNSHSTGFDIGVGIGYPLTTYLEGLVRGNYNRFDSDFSAVEPFTSWSGSANLKLKAPVHRSRFMPYALAGGGIYHLGVKDNLESKFGMQFAVGVDVRTTSRVNLMVEPNYNVVFTDNESIQFFPIRVGAGIRLGR